jgi:hypothetical protein
VVESLQQKNSEQNELILSLRGRISELEEEVRNKEAVNRKVRKRDKKEEGVADLFFSDCGSKCFIGERKGKAPKNHRENAV